MVSIFYLGFFLGRRSHVIFQPHSQPSLGVVNFYTDNVNLLNQIGSTPRENHGQNHQIGGALSFGMLY